MSLYSGTIQLGGLASGLDTDAIINALVGLAYRPVQLLENQKTTEQNKLSLLGTLNADLAELQAKADILAEADTLTAYLVTPADPSVATFSITGEAPTGAHSLTVNSLASADRWSFGAVASSTTDLGAGSVSFSYNGTNYNIALGASPSSLNDIASAINSQAGDDVTASVVNVGTGSYQLVLAGNDTGAANAISGLTSTIAGLSGASNLVAAADAQIVIDGLTISQSSNIFIDALAGLTITALSEGMTTTFTIDVDDDGIKTKVQDFIKEYNDIVSFISSQNSYDATNGVGGDLFGDSVLSSVQGALFSSLFNVDLAVVQADTKGYSTLGLVGIDLGADGLLTIDDTTFDAKLAGDLTAFSDLFADTTNGLAVKLTAAIDGLIDTTTDLNGNSNPGIVDLRTTTIGDTISRLQDEIDRMNSSLANYQGQLESQFSALEGIMAGLNFQLGYLSQLSLPGLKG